ncbi:MAG: hypothetical protein GX127_02660 [Eubacteriaceae bacterium]|nr:hypothetical protein [Eubacteriaceae bacterium]
MSMEALKRERIQLFKDAIIGDKKPERIPIFSNMWSWKILDAGYKLSEALNDYEILKKSLRHFYENYPADICHETGWRNPIQVTESMGNNAYIINDDQNSISIKDQCYMKPEDYDALISNPKKFLWETFLPRKFKYLKGSDSSDALRVGIQNYAKFGQFMGEVAQINEEFGIPDFFDPNGAILHWANGFEILFNMLRGIRGLSYDIRRNPDKVLAAIEAIDEVFAKPIMERTKGTPKGTNMNCSVDINPVLLAHTILSPKQFEKFYWPHFEKMIDYVTEEDKIVYIFAEGDSERFYDFFRQFPENRFALLVEQNDIFKMKKELPNLTVSGGMPVDLLGKATPKDCTDYAKKLIDELGYDGRYIFSEGKMISFPNDATRENLKATYEFVRDYRG